MNTQLKVRFDNKAPSRHVVANGVYQHLQIDLVDMTHTPVNKKRYILSAIDIFSRYIWLYALPDKRAETVTQKMKKLFSEFGYPRIVQQDRGTEFRGKLEQYFTENDIKIIRSRPYHPQSQGKVERSHRTLKSMMMYDMVKMNRDGLNWTKQLHVRTYQRTMNMSPKQVLHWKCPFHIFFGRDERDNTQPRASTPMEDPILVRQEYINKIREEAKKANEQCNARQTRYELKKLKTPVYEIGQKVLVRYKNRRHKVPKKYSALKGTIIKRKLDNYMYKVAVLTRGGSKDQWMHVSDIKATTFTTPKRNKHFITKEDMMYTRNEKGDRLSQTFGLPIIFDPRGDGSCQYAAVAHQLEKIGIFRSSETLRARNC